MRSAYVGYATPRSWELFCYPAVTWSCASPALKCSPPARCVVSPSRQEYKLSYLRSKKKKYKPVWGLLLKNRAMNLTCVPLLYSPQSPLYRPQQTNPLSLKTRSTNIRSATSRSCGDGSAALWSHGDVRHQHAKIHRLPGGSRNHRGKDTTLQTRV